MSTPCSVLQANPWLKDNGPRELEQLLRAVVYHPSAAVVVGDDEGRYLEASKGVAKLLGVPRVKLVGRPIAEFTPPTFRPKLSELWRAFEQTREKHGVLELVTVSGEAVQVEYVAKPRILPERHVLVLTPPLEPGQQKSSGSVPSWVEDYGLYLLNETGHVEAWYAGAERIYGYLAAEAEGRHISFLYDPKTRSLADLEAELSRALREGHCGTEDWQKKKDGTRFWANCITMAIKDASGKMQGYGRIVRDFTERYKRDAKLRASRTQSPVATTESQIVAVVSGEFDQIPEANDAFLELTGYTREDLASGRLSWPDLTPSEFEPLDEVAHEEGLRFGACTPFEKEFVRKDGTRVPVLVATAVLKLSPYKWISFIHDRRVRDVAVVAEDDDDAMPTDRFDEIVGNSDGLRRVERQIEVVAPTDATVLILGETGTGKELVARAIHRLSPRRNLPFVTLNCAAIPTGLLESELFGYERGAFTGALQQKIGRFEMAHRGTLFLDEVGDIPIDLQPKLLRALQEKSFERLGGTKTIPIDVRLVAATNRNLTEMMGDKLFRSDLYYRLRVFPITTPNLRDRPDDIPLLARYFTQKYSARMGREVTTIPADAMAAMVRWPWPGNVRELENFIERSVILSRGSQLRAPLSEIRNETPQVAGSVELEQVEREHILKIFRECNGVVTTAATRLGLHRTTLNAMMRKLGITRKDL